MFENIDITELIVALIGVLSAVIMRYLIPFLKSKTGSENWNILVEWAVVFVNAAEVMISGSEMGLVKREKVLEDLRRKAEELGLEFSEDDLRAALEAAWKQMSDGVISSN